MAAKHVPRLREKIGIIGSLGGLGSLSKIGNKLDVKESTMRYWINGNDTRNPELVPEKHIPKLVALLRKTLPGERTRLEAQHILFGPLESFLSAYSARPDARWPSFLADHAQGELTIQTKSRPLTRRGPAFLPAAAKPGEKIVPPGSSFHVSFKPVPSLIRKYHTLLLQHDDYGWNRLPMGQNEPVFFAEGKMVVAPVDYDEGYKLPDTAKDRVSFAAVASRSAFEDDLRSAMTESGRLTPLDLDRLAGWLLDQPGESWSVGQTTIFVKR